MSKIIYSLIVPHYNYPEGLTRLLSTVPERADQEIIVVDDCSDNEVFNKIRHICDTRIDIILLSTDNNSGGGAARNLGLNAAHGKYVFFADTDDFFLPSIGILLDRYSQSEADIIFFNAISLNEGDYSIERRTHHLNSYISQFRTDPEKALLNLKYLFGEPWCKIVRKDIIDKNGIHFQETRIHNDTLYSYMVGFYARHCVVDDTACYVVMRRQGSVSVSVNWDKIAIRTEVFAKKNQFLRDNNIAIFDPLILSSFRICIDSEDNIQLERNIKIADVYGGYDSRIKKYIRRRFFEKKHPLVALAFNYAKRIIGI